MRQSEKIVRQFINFYNQRNIVDCGRLLDPNVELRSSYVMHLFPDSNGILKGKSMVVHYLDLLFKNMPDLEAGEIELVDTGNHIVVSAYNLNRTISYYLHYYVNDAGLLYLIKSNMTRPNR